MSVMVDGKGKISELSRERDCTGSSGGKAHGSKRVYGGGDDSKEQESRGFIIKKRKGGREKGEKYKVGGEGKVGAIISAKISLFRSSGTF